MSEISTSYEKRLPLTLYPRGPAHPSWEKAAAKFPRVRQKHHITLYILHTYHDFSRPFGISVRHSDHVLPGERMDPS